MHIAKCVARLRRTVEIDRRPARFRDASRYSPVSAPLRHFFARSKQKCVTTDRPSRYSVSSLLIRGPRVTRLFAVWSNSKRFHQLFTNEDAVWTLTEIHRGLPISTLIAPFSMFTYYDTYNILLEENLQLICGLKSATVVLVLLFGNYD